MNNSLIQHSQHVHHIPLRNYNAINTIAEINIDKNTYLEKNLSHNNYVVATFHPTIGQCTHQSLSSTATFELGMISTRNKGTLEDSYIAKDTTKLS